MKISYLRDPDGPLPSVESLNRFTNWCYRMGRASEAYRIRNGERSPQSEKVFRRMIVLCRELNLMISVGAEAWGKGSVTMERELSP